MAGAQTNHYDVQVRDGEVRQIEVIQADGTRMVRKIARERDTTAWTAFS